MVIGAVPGFLSFSSFMIGMRMEGLRWFLVIKSTFLRYFSHVKGVSGLLVRRHQLLISVALILL